MNIDQESVQHARDAANLTADALRIKISHTVTSTDRIPLRAKMIEAINTAQDLDELEIRLEAGKTAISQLTQPQVTELQSLSQKLDQQIISARLLNLTLSVAVDILESAVRVQDIVKGNLA